MTDVVYGMRCRVVEIRQIDDSLELISDVDGRRFAIPLDGLTGRDALNRLGRNTATWLSVRMEKKQPEAESETELLYDEEPRR